MVDFWERAENMQMIARKATLVDGFGYGGPHGAETAMHDLTAMYVVWLTSMEEGRAVRRGFQNGFVLDVINLLPDSATADHNEPMLHSPLKKCAESLWGLRIAITHGDCQLDKTGKTNRQRAAAAPKHFEGVEITGNRLALSPPLMHLGLRTIEAIRANLDPHIK